MTVYAVIAVMLLGGCVTPGAEESHWTIRFVGDGARSVRALQESAAAFGGKAFGDPGPTGAVYSFGNRTLSFWLKEGAIAVYGEDRATDRKQRQGEQQKLGALLHDLVAKAAHDSNVSLNVTTGESPPSAMPAGPRINAADTRFKEFGDYFPRLFAAIQTQWDAAVAESTTYPPAGSWVSVTFVLAPDGRVTRIKDVESHTTPTGEKLALAGLTSHLPFPPWTAQMKAKLNADGEELTFTFYYQ